jgi:hypothetical protein
MESLYVCLFSNGHVKVGRSTDPAGRIVQHKDRVACIGVNLVASHIIPCDASRQREQILIQRCISEATDRFQSEWFSGLDYHAVIAWAEEAAKASIEPESDWTILFRRRDGFQRRLSDRLGLAPQTVNNWARLGIPPEFCARVEEECQREFSRRDFRPHDWHLIWPELA